MHDLDSMVCWPLLPPVCVYDLGRTSHAATNLARCPPVQPKPQKVTKQQKTVTGRTFTSKFRGVHQTFPTKRWEAQFRRGGKPTSLGCFDNEEEARFCLTSGAS